MQRYRISVNRWMPCTPGYGVEAQEGLEYHLRFHPVNSFIAHRLIHLASGTVTKE
jgi:hypothetical protein